MGAPALATVESWEDHVEAWHHLGREVDGAAWARAAIAASLKGRYGDGAIEKFAAEVGYARNFVFRLARVFEAFPEKSHRCDSLTFTHHLTAVELAGSVAAAKAALTDAEREGWSANALRAHLRPAPELPEAAPTTPSGDVCTESGKCGPLTDADRALHVWAITENLYAVKDYDVAELLKRSTKKSVRDLSAKIAQIQDWLAALQRAAEERLK